MPGEQFYFNKRTKIALENFVDMLVEVKIVIGLDVVIQAAIEAIDKYRIFVDKTFIIEIDCKNIVEHYNKNNCKTSPNKMGQRRWLNLLSHLTRKG